MYYARHVAGITILPEGGKTLNFNNNYMTEELNFYTK